MSGPNNDNDNDGDTDEKLTGAVLSTIIMSAKNNLLTPLARIWRKIVNKIFSSKKIGFRVIFLSLLFRLISYFNQKLHLTVKKLS